VSNGGGGGVAEAIKGGQKDTLSVSESVLAKKQAAAKIISAAPSEMKRNNIELSMNTLQARLNKVSARKGDEKQQQKLALGIEQLKAQLAYATAKTPSEKQSSLAKIKQIAKTSSVQETCNSTADVTIDNNNCFLPCNDNTDESFVFPSMQKDQNCDGGGGTSFQPPQNRNYFEPEICSSGENYGLMIPQVAGWIVMHVCEGVRAGGIIVNSENDISLNDVVTAKRAIQEFTRQVTELETIVNMLGTCNTIDDAEGKKTLQNPDVRCNAAYEMHEETHGGQEYLNIHNALIKTKEDLPAMSQPRSLFKGMSCDQIADAFSKEKIGLVQKFEDNYNIESKNNLLDNERAAHKKQLEFIEALIGKIQTRFNLQ
jgi:hypothetical protein